jgi:hypothetical protein
MKYSEIIFEEVFGNLAIGYHRTNSLDNINEIVVSGFIAGKGDTYGPGVYMTYDLQSQLNSYMISNYGEYIIKNKVNLNNYLIFDENVARTVYGKDWQIEKQLNKFGFKPEQIKAITYDKITNTSGTEIENAPTSLYAHRVYQFKNKNINGLIFTGRADGKVIVSYNISSIKPYQYAKVDYSLITSKKEIEWHKIENSFVPKEKKNIDYQKLAKKYPKEKLKKLAQEQFDLKMVKNDYRDLKYVKSVTEEILLVVIKEQPMELINVFGHNYVDDLSDEFKIKAVNLNPNSFWIFKHPSEDVELAAVQKDGRLIRNINFPSTKIQIAALNQNSHALSEIDHVSDEAYEFLIRKELKANNCELKHENHQWIVMFQNTELFKSDDLSELETFIEDNFYNKY